MRDVIIKNQNNPLQSTLRAGYCESFFCRLRGLMFRKRIPNDWGLLLVQGSESIVNSAIHMFAVPFDLGVIWLNTGGEVVDLAEVKRWIGIKSPKKPAKYILEVTPSRLNEFKLGDRITFK
jgi:uncharacterized membrane protein (UPF0127 family)